jgi:membrane-associated protease RseP (regulator of RpoE activity)
MEVNMNFFIIDITLLILFVIFMSMFLYKNKRNLKKEGLMYLYRTKWGINIIDKTAKKHNKFLNFLSYISIIIGYILMASMIYLFGKIIYLYVAYPSIVKAIKIPPITPLVPYIDKIVPGLGLPSFRFIYWIVILAIIAISHEFAHGVFMRKYNIKIKSKGFGFFPFFLPIFLAAFVEQDEKSMNKSKTFHQLAVLSAGTFANILTAMLFGLIMIGFFLVSFTATGVQFNSYAYSSVNISNIDSINGNYIDNVTYEQIINLSKEVGYNKIGADGKYFLATTEFIKTNDPESYYLTLYDYAPAINSNLEGAITEINGVKINSWDMLGEEINNYSPGDNITLTTTKDKYYITLGENPLDDKIPWLGIGYNEFSNRGLIGRVSSWISSFKKGSLYYEPNFGVAEFIYDFLWWLVLISFSVALVNMLPMGIFDGGRFFYLTIFALTGSKIKAEKWFKGLTNFLLFLVILLMIFWIIGIV